MDDFVSVDTIILLIKHRGSDGVLDGKMLTIYPKGGGAPFCFEVPPTGVGRRLIIKIGKKCDVPSHWFWHPDRALDAVATSTPLVLVKSPSTTQKPGAGRKNR